MTIRESREDISCSQAERRENTFAPEAAVTAPRLVLQFRPDDELGLFTREAVAREKELFLFYRVPGTKHDDRYLQADTGVLLRSAADLHCMIRHACRPTAYVDWQNRSLRALRDLNEGDEITINFLTMYAEIEEPFQCACGAPECVGEVRGFRSLCIEKMLDLELYLSPYLKQILNEQVALVRTQAS